MPPLRAYIHYANQWAHQCLHSMCTWVPTLARKQTTFTTRAYELEQPEQVGQPPQQQSLYLAKNNQITSNPQIPSSSWCDSIFFWCFKSCRFRKLPRGHPRHRWPQLCLRHLPCTASGVGEGWIWEVAGEKEFHGVKVYWKICKDKWMIEDVSGKNKSIKVIFFRFSLFDVSEAFWNVGIFDQAQAQKRSPTTN